MGHLIFFFFFIQRNAEKPEYNTINLKLLQNEKKILFLTAAVFLCRFNFCFFICLPLSFQSGILKFQLRLFLFFGIEPNVMCRGGALSPFAAGTQLRWGDRGYGDVIFAPVERLFLAQPVSSLQSLVHM